MAMSTPTVSHDDATLYARLKTELFTAVVGDVLDRMGLRRQFLPAGLAPLLPTMKIAGRAHAGAGS